MKEKSKVRKNFNILGYSPLLLVFSLITLIYLGVTRNNVDELSEVGKDQSIIVFTKLDEKFSEELIVDTNSMSFIDTNFDSEYELMITSRINQNPSIFDYIDSEFKLKDNIFEVQNVFSTAICDLDGDGQEEIFFSTGLDGGSYADVLYDYIDGSWSKVEYSNTNGRDVSCIDLDGDEIYELVQQVESDYIRLLSYSNGEISTLNDEYKFNVISTGDFLLTVPIFEYSQDLIFTNNNIENIFYENRTGSLKIMDLGESFSNINETVSNINYLDYNQDGLMDLVLSDENIRTILLIQEDGEFKSENLFNHLDKSYTSLIVGDLDLNGIDDILATSLTGANKFFAGLPFGHEELPIYNVENLENITGSLYTFLDDNNNLDIIFGKKQGELEIYEMKDFNNNYISISPQTKYGAPARGVIVKLYSELGIQTKVLDPGSNYHSQLGPEVIFGVANLESIEKVEVYFHDGNKKTLENLESNSNYIIKND